MIAATGIAAPGELEPNMLWTPFSARVFFWNEGETDQLLVGETSFPASEMTASYSLFLYSLLLN